MSIVLTPVTSQYLEAIHVLSDEGQTVIGARLAEYLGVTPPTVTQTLRRMEREGLITISGTREREVLLTEEGQQLAKKVVRKHRLIERWLADGLGLDWIDAHEEASRLEHAISPLVEQRISEIMGYPETCPHGNPIPGFGKKREGGFSLDQAEEGAQVEIERILEHVEDLRPLLEFFADNGLIPGAHLRVVDKSPFGGIQVQVDDRTVNISPEYASKLWVHPLNA